MSRLVARASHEVSPIRVVPRLLWPHTGAPSAFVPALASSSTPLTGERCEPNTNDADPLHAADFPASVKHSDRE